MRIGILLVAYQCEQYINSVLAPWSILKCGLTDDLGIQVQKPAENLEIVIVAVSAQFKGFGDDKVYDNENTSVILNAHKRSGAIDEYIEIKDKQIWDFESRVAGWNYLKNKGCDLIWQLDGDEIYREREILKAIAWIKENRWVDYYRVRFKNFIGNRKDNSYVDTFCPTRIIWTNKNGGIKNFYWDNDVEYMNGSKTPDVSHSIIPKPVLFPNHHSWDYSEIDGPQRVIDKIQFQKKTLGVCSYKFEDNKLQFDDSFYLKYNVTKPIIYYS